MITKNFFFFDGELNVDLNEFQTNLVPFPRLHFMITSMAPVTSEAKKHTEKNDVQDISDFRKVTLTLGRLVKLHNDARRRSPTPNST